MRRFFALSLLLPLFTQLAAQPDLKIPAGPSLKALIDSTRKIKDDSLRLKVNNDFFQLLSKTLSDDKTDLLVSDSLNIGKITSDDGFISIYCWNIQQNNGENYYSAVIKNRKANRVIPLLTKKSTKNLTVNNVFRNGEWPGGLFYKIITRKTGGKTIYTLLCWDRFNQGASRKSIEWLAFDAQGLPVFGAPVFKSKEGISNRVIFEYAAQSSFTMNYSRQKAILEGVRRSQKNVDDEMIVVDRLIPLNSNLIGQNWAMVPAGNTYDAYIFLDGYWIFTENISARNPASVKKQPKVREKAEQGLFPKK